MYPCPNCTKLSKVSPRKYGPGYICENGHVFEKEPVPPIMSGLTPRALDVCPVCEGKGKVANTHGVLQFCIPCDGTGQRQ